jgi:hypothetical protein
MAMTAAELALWTRRWNKIDHERAAIAAELAYRRSLHDKNATDLVERARILVARTEAEVGGGQMATSDLSQFAYLACMALQRACEGMKSVGGEPPLHNSQRNADDLRIALDEARESLPPAKRRAGPARGADSGRLMDAGTIMAELGIRRSAVDAIMRLIPTVQIPGHSKKYVKRTDLEKLLAESTVQIDPLGGQITRRRR